VHALVIGVSSYPHLPGGSAAQPGSPGAGLGLTQLAAPALTAYQVHQWLLDHRDELPVPLHTVRLLLAPSADELEGIVQAGEPTYAGIRAALNDWRADLARFAKSMAFFFYSGHGLGGTGEDALMLAADFGDPAVDLLDRAVSVTDVEQGMAPPRPGGARTIGRRQAYFVDACRNRPPGLTVDSALVPTVWDEQVDTAEADRELAILLATINGQQAYVGAPGEATVFGQALLECLEGAAAEADGDLRWSVGTAGISSRLPERMEERTARLRVRQSFRPGRQLMPIRLVTFAETPRVEVTFPVTGATPAANLRVDLSDLTGVTSFNPLELPVRAHPVPMGHYGIVARAVVPPPTEERRAVRILRPPRHEFAVDL
jgi:hypothetical protein